MFIISSLITAVVSFSFGLLVFIEGKNLLSKVWFLFSVIIALWALTLWGIVGSNTIESAELWQYFSDIVQILLPVAYLYFVSNFLNINVSRQMRIFGGGAVFLSALSITSFFKLGVVQKFGFYWINPGPLYFLFPIFFATVISYSFFLLMRAYWKEASGSVLRSQIGYQILAGVIGFSGGATSFLPQIFNIFPFGNYLVLLYVFFVSYSIIKHHLFNLKVIAAELLTFAIWGAVLTQALTADTFNGKLLGGGTLFFAVVLGIFLIKSVKKEVAQREQIEELAGRLKSVNRIMSHDIKNVLGKNKDMYGMLLDGTFGVIPDGAKPFLERLLCDTKQLVRSVISILESGQELTLKLASFDVKIPVLEIVKDVSHDAEEKGLTVRTDIDQSQDYTILGDEAQLSTRVFRNLIENAVNYTLAGSVTVGLFKKADKVIFSVADTGVGITEEDQKNLFQEGGHGKDSLKVNVHSTGYGLFSAKKVVDAHKGKIWFETIPGKGTTFFVELPREGETGRIAVK